MAFLFSSPVQISTTFTSQDTRKRITLPLSESSSKSSKSQQTAQNNEILIYNASEDVSGVVELSIASGKAVQHQGIVVEFVGQIEAFYDRGNVYDFVSVTNEVDEAGELSKNKSFNFDFKNVEKQFDSYQGINVRLRYFVRITIKRQYSPNLSKEFEIFIQTAQNEPDINNSIKMEVGIEDCLHIEFEYNKSKYHLRDAIVGKVFFLLVRIKIKHMEVSIIKRESQGSGPNLYNESETITKYEVMDGAPVRGESIPIRLFLSGYDLTPTMKNVHGKFSVKYYINLVLVDEEDRRYFKQQEIVLYRKP